MQNGVSINRTIFQIGFDPGVDRLQHLKLPVHIANGVDALRVAHSAA
jgi:hypothetical protein